MNSPQILLSPNFEKNLSKVLSSINKSEYSKSHPIDQIFLVGFVHSDEIRILYPVYTDYQDLKNVIPCGLSICGVITLHNCENLEFELSKLGLQNIFEDFSLSSFVCCNCDSMPPELSFTWFCYDGSGLAKVANVKTLNHDVHTSLKNEFIILRAPFTLNIPVSWNNFGELTSQVSKIAKCYSEKVKKEEILFQVGDDSDEEYVLFSSDEELADSSRCLREISKSYVRSEKNNFPCLTLNVAFLMTGSSRNRCVPVIKFQSIQNGAGYLTYNLDILNFCKSTTPFHTIASQLKLKLSQQLLHISSLVQKEVLAIKNVDINQDFALPLYNIYHFWPDEIPFPISVAYQHNKTDEDADLVERRKLLHQKFSLDSSRPIFRRINDFFTFKKFENHLMNPHSILSPSKQKGESVALVKGCYAYYHYNQDGVSDSGWGCAYRSLQTIISWFILQGYYDGDVPSHLEIQKALVEMKDKPSSFIGSRHWIGSTEIGFCLDFFLNITCKFIHANSGNEISDYGSSLLKHFNETGTPIMIGGDNYAHTIIGVSFDETTGDVQYLVLDPHNTNYLDSISICNKGFCNWKGSKFWNSQVFYNLCLPQVDKSKF